MLLENVKRPDNSVGNTQKTLSSSRKMNSVSVMILGRMKLVILTLLPMLLVVIFSGYS